MLDPGVNRQRSDHVVRQAGRQYVEEMDRRRAAPTDPCAAGFTFHIAGLPLWMCTRRSDSRLRSCPVNSRANPWRTYRKRAGLRRFSNQPVAEIVQCGEPKPLGPFGFGSVSLALASLGRPAFGGCVHRRTISFFRSSHCDVNCDISLSHVSCGGCFFGLCRGNCRSPL
jgi:hypothetical protein